MKSHIRKNSYQLVLSDLQASIDQDEHDLVIQELYGIYEPQICDSNVGLALKLANLNSISDIEKEARVTALDELFATISDCYDRVRFRIRKIEQKIVPSNKRLITACASLTFLCVLVFLLFGKLNSELTTTHREYTDANKYIPNDITSYTIEQDVLSQIDDSGFQKKKLKGENIKTADLNDDDFEQNNDHIPKTLYKSSDTLSADNGLIDPASWSQPDVQAKLGEYKLTFSDEFNADRLSKYRWNTSLLWDGSHNGEHQSYVNVYSKDQKHSDKVVPVHDPFEFNGSRLAIRAKVNTKTPSDSSNVYSPEDRMFKQSFLSGAITTYDKFNQKYGYFEARIKIPKQVGTFPAFWLLHQPSKWENTNISEIDIIENLAHAPGHIYSSFHYFTSVSEGVSGTPHYIKPQPQGQIHTGIDHSGNDSSQDYHVYAAEWEPDNIKFMIDGEVVNEIRSNNFNHEDFYILLSLASDRQLSDEGETDRDPYNYFPNRNDNNISVTPSIPTATVLADERVLNANWSNPALEIDYVRVYKPKKL